MYDYTCSTKVKAFLLNHWQVQFLSSLFISLTNKGYGTHCANNCSIAVFRYAIRILLKTFLQLETHIEYGKPVEQAG